MTGAVIAAEPRLLHCGSSRFDFTDVGDFEQSACTVLAKILSATFARNVVLLGVTPSQSRMLERVRVECKRS